MFCLNLDYNSILQPSALLEKVILRDSSNLANFPNLDSKNMYYYVNFHAILFLPNVEIYYKAAFQQKPF